MLTDNLLYEVSKRQVSDDVSLYIFSFPKQTPKKAIKKSLHRFLADNILSGLCNIEASGKINRLFYEENVGRRTLNYSFSYSNEIGVLICAKDRDVATDIVNPKRVENLEIDFFTIPDKAYKEIENSGFGKKTVSWAIQEAIGKMKRTGLKKKYAVIDIVSRDGCRFVRFTADEKDDECELSVINCWGFCIVTTVCKNRERQEW